MQVKVSRAVDGRQLYSALARPLTHAIVVVVIVIVVVVVVMQCNE